MVRLVVEGVSTPGSVPREVLPRGVGCAEVGDEEEFVSRLGSVPRVVEVDVRFRRITVAMDGGSVRCFKLVRGDVVDAALLIVRAMGVEGGEHYGLSVVLGLAKLREGLRFVRILRLLDAVLVQVYADPRAFAGATHDTLDLVADRAADLLEKHGEYLSDRARDYASYLAIALGNHFVIRSLVESMGVERIVKSLNLFLEDTATIVDSGIARDVISITVETQPDIDRELEQPVYRRRMVLYTPSRRITLTTTIYPTSLHSLVEITKRYRELEPREPQPTDTEKNRIEKLLNEILDHTLPTTTIDLAID